MKRPQFDTPHLEGYLSISAGDLHYREFGTGPNVLVGLHGGPGTPQDYLAPLEAFAGEEWTVYLYDQYGCGGRTAHRSESSITTPWPVTATDSTRCARHSASTASTSTVTVGWLARTRVRTLVPRPRRVASARRHLGGRSPRGRDDARGRL